MDIDLNCDLGEGFPNDAALMPFITSANVSCGFHAGDASIALATLELAARHQVQVGAHPGFADREHFGRRELERTPRQIFEECVHQIGALAGLARTVDVELRYLKPHGALYNMACRDEMIAAPIVSAAEVFGLGVMGLPASKLEKACRERCRFIAEGFADRRYLPDGSLVARSQPDAFVVDTGEAVRQAEWLVRERGVETLCVHGDNPEAVRFIAELRTELTAQGIHFRAFR
jgi:UPF0271 protein